MPDIQLTSDTIQLIAVLGTLFGGIITGWITFVVSKMNSNADIQKFYEEKISQLLETQSREIRDLKAENERLVNEVKALSEQVLELRKNSKCKDCPFEL